jgi:hypothetical protein
MKLRVLLVALAVSMLSVSAAVAAPPTGKGKPPTKGEGCKPKVTVVLKGTLDSVSSGSLAMKVNRANRWGRAWANAGSASVTLDQKTKVRGNGMKSVEDLAKLKSGDRVLVQARVCKVELDDSAMPDLTAVRVVGHPAHPEKDTNDND